MKNITKILELDTIIDVVIKMKSIEGNIIALQFPFGHPILHNYLSLKILKAKAGKKDLIIITSDIISRKIGKKLGIKYSIIKDNTFFSSRKKIENNILKKNFTFWEYFIFEINKYKKKVKNIFIKNPHFNKITYYSPYDKIKKSGVGLLLLGLIGSFLMFIFIFYFAVSKTYVYITPEVHIKTKAGNILYKIQDSDKSIFTNKNIVDIVKKTYTTNIEKVFKSTSIDYKNTSRAYGKITLYNELSENQRLRPKTRLLNSEGILFETKEWVNLPKASKDKEGNLKPSETEVDIIAKTHDINGAFIGSRGNISSGILTIPGLKFNRDKIYGKVISEIKGGNDNFGYIISENDLKNTKSIFIDILKKKSLNDLKFKIEEENNLNNTNYEILGANKTITYKDIKIINIGDIKVGDKIDKFKLKGEVTIEAYTYNKDSVTTILKKIVTDSLLQGTEKLMFIDDKSLRISNEITRTDEPLMIKATTEVNVGISYNFNNNSNDYIKNIKNTIMGLEKGDATNILLNNTKISNVFIKNSPFFLKKVSSIPENIILKIKD